MEFLTLSHVVKEFGTTRVIKGVDISARKGEFIVFVGPSGCGKSTLLRMIAGLEEVTSGQIVLDGRDVTKIAPADREVSMVFQSYALYPHMNAFNNMAFGLKMAKLPESEITERVHEAARILQIESLLDRKPGHLSGGQRQRVAIGRAIVRKPKLFLFDEPLSNLDAELRSLMRIEIAKLHRALDVTMVYVTHDQIEAMTLADRIVVLRQGVIEQFGSPTELYDDPKSKFVAGFIGSPKMNFLPVKILSIDSETITVGSADIKGGSARFAKRTLKRGAVGDQIEIGFRPENIKIGNSDSFMALTFEAAENLGGHTHVFMRSKHGELVTAVETGRPNYNANEPIEIGLSENRVYFFDQDGGSLSV